MVRCKVTCIKTGEIDYGNGPAHTAEFSAVYDSNPESENGKFFAATPSLTLSVGVTKEQHFKVGEQYYLDFTPVSTDT